MSLALCPPPLHVFVRTVAYLVVVHVSSSYCPEYMQLRAVTEDIFGLGVASNPHEIMRRRAAQAADAEFHHATGLQYAQDGQFERALQHFKKAATLEPASVDHEEAIAFCEEAIAEEWREELERRQEMEKQRRQSAASVVVESAAASRCRRRRQFLHGYGLL